LKYVLVTLWPEGTLLIPTRASLIVFPETVLPVWHAKSIPPTAAPTIVFDSTVALDEFKAIALSLGLLKIVLNLTVAPNWETTISPNVMLLLNSALEAAFPADINPLATILLVTLPAASS
jgi:hypothetical protein